MVEIVGGRDDDFERAILVIKQGRTGVGKFTSQLIGGVKVSRAKNITYWLMFLARYGSAFLLGAVSAFLLMKIV